VDWKWTEAHRKAFNKAKKIVAHDVMLAYPNFNKEFVIHTDASHTQLGAMISQDGKPIAFFSRKLNGAQTWYTTTERELLSIVETLKEFHTILLGMKIVVHTNHKNLTYTNFNTKRVMHWRLILEEFGPELRNTSRANATSSQMLSVILTWHHAIVKNSMPSLKNTTQQARKTTLPTFQSATACLNLNSRRIVKLRNFSKIIPMTTRQSVLEAWQLNYELMVDKEGCIYVPKQLQKRTMYLVP
jgi:hypothetical protein